MKKRDALDDLLAEYSHEAAHAAEQRNRALREQQERERQARQARNQRLQQPIGNREELSSAVAQLAGAWGLKRKGKR